jgi:hypothetical protein
MSWKDLELKYKEKEKKWMYNPETIRKKKLIRKFNPTPYELLEGYGMRNVQLLTMISGNGNIPNYFRTGEANYFCEVRNYTIFLHFNGFDDKNFTSNSLVVEMKEPFKEPSVCEATIENGELKRRIVKKTEDPDIISC